MGVINLNITEFAAHVQAEWVPAAYRFAKGMENFKIDVAKTAQSVFRGSFELERFNTDGSSPWQPLAPSTVKRRKGSAHPILTRLGTLQRSISYSIDNKTEVKYADEQVDFPIIKSNKQMLAVKGRTEQEADVEFAIGKRASGETKYTKKRLPVALYKASGKVRIFTDPRPFKKLNKKSRVCYAAIHNEGSVGGFFNRKAGRGVPQRQFMGHSTKVDLMIRLLTRVWIIDNLPG